MNHFVSNWTVWLLFSLFCVIVIECPQPEKPVNGDTFDKQAMYGVNDTVEFFCYYGYQLVGKATWTCQDNGKWNEVCVTCMRKGKNPLQKLYKIYIVFLLLLDYVNK